MPKAFIIYPHNPEPYVWIPPTGEDELRRRYPEKSDNEILQIRLKEAEAIDRERKRQINCHNELVDRFAKFLLENGVDVVYEGQIQDTSVPNIMRWFQDQLRDCKYIILIITRSFHHFLSNPSSLPHDGEEPIFEGQFLHTLIHQPGKTLLPVFLGGDKKDLRLLPDALRLASTFHVKTTSRFSLFESEMDSLYAVLTDQTRVAPRSPGRVVQLPQKNRFGPRRQQPQQLTGGLNQARYRSLQECFQPLTTEDVLKLAESDSFSKHWKKLASSLGIPAPQVDCIEGDESELGERCYKMLCCWKDGESSATVAKLADGVWKCRDEAMLDKVYNFFLSPKRAI